MSKRMANTNYVIEPNNLKQEMIDLGHDFVEFWREFADTMDAIPNGNTEKLVSAWSEFFVSHNRTTLKLIKVKMAVDQLAEHKEVINKNEIQH